MADDLSGTVALVTGGARGIGLNVARELLEAGARVAISARSGDGLERAGRELGVLTVRGDVSVEADVARMVEETEAAYGPIDLLVANAGISGRRTGILEGPAADWWHVFEVNVLGTYLCCRAVLPAMLERGRGRIVLVGSGASYLPVGPGPVGGQYGASKAAVGRFGEYLAAEVGPRGVAVFVISPGLVQTDMTAVFGPDMPWTPPEAAPQLVRVLASGRADRLAGRYLHAEHDDIEQLIRRADEVVENDLNAIRLQR
jgi:3-oxoacyl-[acyl-carrier protein] reductase